MNTQAAEKNSDMLLEKGSGFRKWGFRLFLAGVVLWVITLIVIWSNAGDLSYIDLDDILENIILIFLSASLFNLGVPIYFVGLHFIGLGQIAKNTDNVDQIVKNTEKEDNEKGKE